MKKLSFFLMAMLMSVMSFAETELFTQTYPGSPSSYTNAYTKSFTVTTGNYTLTYTNINNGQASDAWTAIRSGSKKGASVATIASEQIAAPIAKVVMNFTQANVGSTNALYLEVSANSDFSSVTKIEADIAVGSVEFPIATPAANQYYKITIDQAKGSANGFNRFDKVVFYQGEAAGEDVETVAAPEFSVTEANFTEAFNLTITSAEGTTLKYTTDKTDPTTSATAVVVESNTATVAISAKSTMVKAVAVKGELVSNVKSMTFCYVNSEATAYTVTEALAIYNEGLGLSNKLYIKGSVKSIEDLNTEYGNATYTITDGESDLYIYRGKNFGGEKFTSADQLFVDDDLVLYGQLTSYNGNPQVAANSEIISRESKTKSILAEDLTFDAIALGDEVEAQTLTVTGANLTAEITATLDNEKFTVTPATLPAAGGDLTIAPAADLTVGEHTATLTLTSGETVKEVALSILVKDVYSINWSVNGTIANETKVVAGDKLVLPVAPAAPDACSEKVFVGWATTSTVNAEGSGIEYVTNATVPTESTTYYAVFATQEGEGGAAEEGTVTLAYTGSTTINMDVEANNAATVGLDATKWNVTASKGDNNNAPGLNKAGDVRIYYGSPTSNTITVASLDENVTISTIVITYTGDTYSNGKIIVNDAVVTGTDGTYEINANSFTITNGNTSNVQVRFENIVINYTAASYTDYSTTCDTTTTALDNVTTTVAPVKAIVNGQLVIIKNGVQYNAQGAVVK